MEEHPKTTHLYTREDLKFLSGHLGLRGISVIYTTLQKKSQSMKEKWGLNTQPRIGRDHFDSSMLLREVPIYGRCSKKLHSGGTSPHIGFRGFSTLLETLVKKAHCATSCGHAPNYTNCRLKLKGWWLWWRVLTTCYHRAWHCFHWTCMVYHHHVGPLSHILFWLPASLF